MQGEAPGEDGAPGGGGVLLPIRGGQRYPVGHFGGSHRFGLLLGGEVIVESLGLLPRPPRRARRLHSAAAPGLRRHRRLRTLPGAPGTRAQAGGTRFIRHPMKLRGFSPPGLGLTSSGPSPSRRSSAGIPVNHGCGGTEAGALRGRVSKGKGHQQRAGGDRAPMGDTSSRASGVTGFHPSLRRTGWHPRQGTGWSPRGRSSRGGSCVAGYWCAQALLCARGTCAG